MTSPLILNPDGSLDPSMHGKTVRLDVVIGYPGSRMSDLLIGGEKVTIPNDALREAAVDQPVEV